MKAVLMDPIVGYAIFVLLFLLLAIWLGKQIKAVRNQIAAEMSAEEAKQIPSENSI